MHSDGTIAEYLHIKQRGAKVKIGDKVKAGQFITESGNVGWSTGPHLHFSVYLQRLDGTDYIRTLFKVNDTLEYLKEKKSYLKNY